jgi:adenylate cyclase
MTLKQDIFKTLKIITDQDFFIEKINYIPYHDDLKFQTNTGLEFDAITVYIDLRNTPEQFNSPNKSAVLKAHLSYFHTISKIASAMGGDIRNLNNGNLVIFFKNDSIKKLNNAIEAAFIMLYMLRNMRQNSSPYPIDFGIGIDVGTILCVKSHYNHDKELVWLGNTIKRAIAISHLCISPHYIGVSETIYKLLRNETKYSIQDGKKTNFWIENTFSFHLESEKYYYMNKHDWK